MTPRSLIRALPALLPLFAGAAAARAASTVPVFGDSFDTAAFLFEQYKPVPPDAWRVENGRLSTSPPGGAFATLLRPVPEDCDVSVDIVPLALDGAYFAGVTLHGVNFLIRDGGFWNPYNIEGVKHALGGFHKADIAPGAKYRFRIVCRRADKALMFSWSVNGEKIAEFAEAGKLSRGRFAFFANRMPAAYDNLSVSALAAGDVPRNLLANGSFEHTQDAYPLNWKLGDPSRMLASAETVDGFWQTWEIDRAPGAARSGAACLKLESGSVQSHQASITIGSPVTCSIYARADADGLPFSMDLWETYGKTHRKAFTASRDWRRYEMTVASPAANSIRIGISLPQKGVLRLDDAQIELGETATPYAASALDIRFAGPGAETPVFPAKIVLRRFPRPPVLDGTIEETWRSAAAAGRFLIAGKTAPRYGTEAFLGCDDSTLYIAFRCRAGDVSRLSAAAKDGRAVWTDDCVEIFLDPGLTRSRYIHLGVNCAGVKAAQLGSELPDTGAWEAKAAVHPDRGCWEVEVRIPLAVIAPGRTAGAEWGINLCRNERSMDEQSCTALGPRVNFHDAAWYGSLVWPKGLSERFALDVVDLRISEAADGESPAVSGVLLGTAATPRTVAIRLSSGGVPLAADIPAALDASNAARFAAPCARPAGKTDIAIDGEIRTASGDLLRKFEQLVGIRARIEAFTQLDYYMNEPEATLVAVVNMPVAPGTAGTVLLADGTGTVVRRIAVASIKPRMRIAVPIASLAPGAYVVRIEIPDGSRTATAETTLVKRPFAENGVRIDSERRCLIVEGRPFLVVAPLIHLFSEPAEYIRRLARHWAGAGFRTVMVVKNSRHADFKRCFDDTLAACAENGLKTILWPGYDISGDPTAQCDRVMEPFKTAPSLIAWLPIDEPDMGSPAVRDGISACIGEFRRRDPYHPAYMNNFSTGLPARYAGMTDILSIDDYITNAENRTVGSVLAKVAAMTGVATQNRKPAWMFLSGANLHNHPREPSVAEQTAQTYGTLITGCSGIVYFLGQPSCKLHWDALRRLNAELLGLSDAVFSLEEVRPAAVSPAAVVSMTRKLDGSVYVISVNTENRPVEAAVVLPDGLVTAGPADVLFEKRTVGIAAGRFTDAYAPHERHVYRIRCAE